MPASGCKRSCTRRRSEVPLAAKPPGPNTRGRLDLKMRLSPPPPSLTIPPSRPARAGRAKDPMYDTFWGFLFVVHPKVACIPATLEGTLLLSKAFELKL